MDVFNFELIFANYFFLVSGKIQFIIKITFEIIKNVYLSKTYG